MGKNKSLEYIGKYVKCMNPAKEIDTDLISRQAAGKTFCALCNGKRFGECEYSNTCQSLRALQSVPPVKDMGEVSDGYHTFNQLYHQRAVLFATIVNQNKDKAWKSWKHEDGKFCFDKGGDWFIVGVDTPEGSYTYHYEKKYWDLFDCEELDRGKHWDGHTEDDVTRLLSLPPVEPKPVCEDAIRRVKNDKNDICIDPSNNNIGICGMGNSNDDGYCRRVIMSEHVLRVIYALFVICIWEFTKRMFGE